MSVPAEVNRLRPSKRNTTQLAILEEYEKETNTSGRTEGTEALDE